MAETSFYDFFSMCQIWGEISEFQTGQGIKDDKDDHPSNLAIFEICWKTSIFFSGFRALLAVFSPQDLKHRPPDTFFHRSGPIFIEIRWIWPILVIGFLPIYFLSDIFFILVDPVWKWVETPRGFDHGDKKTYEFLGFGDHHVKKQK